MAAFRSSGIGATALGTDVHGPWVEWVQPYRGEEKVTLVAQLDWERDYVLFDVLTGARHGPDPKWTMGPSKGIPAVVSHQWKEHLQRGYKYGWDDRRRMRKEMLANRPKGKHQKTWETYVDSAWPDEHFDHEAYRDGTCFGHSWVSIEEAKEAARRYVEYFVSWERDDPAAFAGRDWERSLDLDLAIEIMEWADAHLCGITDSIRLCFCFDC